MVKIKLGDVIDFKNGKSIKKSEGIIPVYGGNGILGYTDKSNFSHTIVVGRVGAYCGSIHVEENSCWVSDNAIAGVPKEGQDLTYLYYVLKSLNLNSKQIGSSQPLITQSMLKDMVVDIEIDIEKQKRIANSISIIDQKIQINNQINQELEAMAKTLYDYWFVQFDFPDQYGKPYKSSGGKMVYNPELKREIPEGWGVTTFSSWISDNKTGDWGKETSQGNYTLEVDCIRGADINGLSGNGKTDMPTRFILEKNKNKLLTDFDIVIEISGGSPTQSTGRIVGISENVLNRFDLPLICSNFCKAVSLKEQETFYNFVYEWKNLYDNGVLFSWEGKTSGIKNLLFDSFVTNYHIAQPPIGLMEQFFDYASSVDRKIQLLLKQNQELTQLRDWLLPMLMNGQVKVE
ncbi:restriction endonuclease subunit S [Streptococcus sanguinis]|uniref:restriction endonuclease subunit S n=1 Tax=Streptococcus sanguinis TaxID=1305 RepID=UPI001459963C|nr:restriction endonuclease subunit S [Streptococcus sanguinis]NMH33645.1 restriction endonuclease subunit S [Streptococcus sanguinis]